MFIIVNRSREARSYWLDLKSRFVRAHGPTWVTAFVIYGAWVVLTLAHARLPLPLLIVAGGVVVAWHGSLQHETIHGHPAGPRWLGRMLGEPPLSLWLPYEVYRDTHRRHHLTHHLTDPRHDPEAPVDPDARPKGRLARAIHVSQQTTLGRLALGPLLTIGVFLREEVAAVRRGEPGHRRAWLLHALSVSLVILWLAVVAELPLWKYLVAFVYPGTSLSLLRSLAEHRVDPDPERRTAVVEAGWFFRLLYLNNNFHVAHHAAPRAPWFELPRVWAEHRAEFSERAPDLVYPGYLSVAARRFVRAPRRIVE